MDPCYDEWRMNPVRPPNIDNNYRCMAMICTLLILICFGHFRNNWRHVNSIAVYHCFSPHCFTVWYQFLFSLPTTHFILILFSFRMFFISILKLHFTYFTAFMLRICSAVLCHWLHLLCFVYLFVGHTLCFCFIQDLALHFI